MTEFFGSEPLISKAGEVSPQDALKDAKVIGLYFSMHHCAPCQEFTPLLVDLYNEFNESEKQFEVVFLSGDKTQQEFDMYYGTMPWVALPRQDKRLADIAKKYSVRGVPRLVFVKPDGTLVHDNAVKKVTDEGPAAIEEFLSS
jgi:nucleoredoxin